jgi:hypothetical protein
MMAMCAKSIELLLRKKVWLIGASYTEFLNRNAICICTTFHYGSDNNCFTYEGDTGFASLPSVLPIRPIPTAVSFQAAAEQIAFCTSDKSLGRPDFFSVPPIENNADNNNA